MLTTPSQTASVDRGLCSFVPATAPYTLSSGVPRNGGGRVAVRGAAAPTAESVSSAAVRACRRRRVHYRSRGSRGREGRSGAAADDDDHSHARAGAYAGSSAAASTEAEAGTPVVEDGQAVDRPANTDAPCSRVGTGAAPSRSARPNAVTGPSRANDPTR